LLAAGETVSDRPVEIMDSTEAERVKDLCDLFTAASAKTQPTPTAEAIANVLRGRFLAEKTYTYVSPFSLVSINPNKLIQANADAVLWEYIGESWEIGDAAPRTETLSPHIWQLTSRSYFYMRRTGQDQAIVMKWAGSLPGVIF
jgi:myosin heavy subunit